MLLIGVFGLERKSEREREREKARSRERVKDRERKALIIVFGPDSLNEREICPGINAITGVNYKWSGYSL